MADDARTAWTRPGAEEISAGVFRIPLPLPQDGLRAANVYAVLGASGQTVLIDAGWAVDEARAELERALASIEIGLEQVTDILVTHSHRDHYTMAVAVRREFGTSITLGAAERINAEALAVLPPYPELPQRPLLARAGAVHLADVFVSRQKPVDSSEWELPDHWAEHESTIEVAGRSLRVLHTPGHTRGHVVYVDRAAGLMFSGDHVLPQITPSLAFEQSPPFPPDNALRDFLGSLQLLRSGPDALVLPGHGPATARVHARVDELLEHHARRLDETASAVGRGASTAHEVAGLLRWTRRLRRLDEMDAFNQMLATLETAAHLDLLVERGLLASDEPVAAPRDRVAHYRIA